MDDVLPQFSYNKSDHKIFEKILKYEGTAYAIKEFEKHCNRLSDYGYWFGLSTLWVSYTGFSDLNLWKYLFSSNRSNREMSIMKPSELNEYKNFPEILTVYRAHRENENDWIAYTLSAKKAAQFSIKRDVKTIKEYEVNKNDILCLFLRRGEQEIIILDKNNVKFIKDISVIVQ